MRDNMIALEKSFKIGKFSCEFYSSEITLVYGKLDTQNFPDFNL